MHELGKTKKLSAEERQNKILKLDKFEMLTQHYYYAIYIDGTGFRYNASLNRWWKIPEPYIHTYPLPDGFYDEMINQTGYFASKKLSSIEEVLETVSDDIRDSILFNINLFR